MQDNKPQVSLVVVGNVDAGKSTTIGQLIYKTGGIDERVIEKYRKESDSIGMKSFTFAWVLDKLQAERERGITINTSVRPFETSKYHYTIIDTPGHRDYIKNMITGTTQADVALLILSAVPPEYQYGLSKNGQTMEHCLLCFTLGVSQMIVAVNKMDSPEVKYLESIFESTKKDFSDRLKTIGYKPSTIPFIPISAWNGENLVERSEKIHWYSGISLLEALDSINPPKRRVNLPLRIPVSDVFKIKTVGTVVAGKVQTGKIKTGTKLYFAPSGVTSECLSIQYRWCPLQEAVSGDNIAFHVKDLSENDIKRGHVASDYNDNPASEVEKFTARIFITKLPRRIYQGYSPIIDCHTAHVVSRFDKIVSKLNKKNGDVIEKDPEFLVEGDSAIVEMTPKKPLCVETYPTFPPLGRFAVRDLKQTIAIGVIKSITKKAKVSK